ncbi:hypothetical protein [Thiosocius teredinicola]|uniref:hypothetical protein n=1 Tax=Thiosocius teredinicola TaxID=1973002 RepID=UPI0009912DC5
MDRDLSLEKELMVAISEFAPRITWVEAAYELVAKIPGKEVTVTWPYPLMEVFFDFVGPGDEKFSESVEFYEGESSAELAEYVANVVRRFLLLPVRIHTRKGWLSVTELQVEENGGWQCVFE